MLIFEAPSRESATRFLRGDRDASLDQVSPIFSRWARSVELGVTADAAAFPVVTTDADLATRRDRLADVFREKETLFGPLQSKLSTRSCVAVLADPDGYVLATQHFGDLDDPALRVGLVEGARWSENVRGTNAVGTAIAERQPVAVIGAAHFELRNHGIFCYGHPIFDAYGDLVAVLDVTGPVEAHSQEFGPAVQAAASSLEQALRRIAYAQSGAVTLAAIERLIHRSTSATLLVEASGRVAMLNDTAREVLGVGDGAALSCERLFGLGFAELRRLAIEGARDLRFEMASAELRVELDTVAGAGGRTFAILVHLDDARRGKLLVPTATARAKTVSPSQPPAAAPPSVRVQAPSHAAFAPVFGTDPALVAAKDAATRFAATDLPVLLLAETGTGKELFARAIHAASARASGPFVALNCGALTGGVLESELFGHAPSSFIGASRHGVDGKIAAANRGTLFLDEIDEMPDDVQAALLRVLDHGGAHYRVGETRPRSSDFRLVCATCRDLPELVEKGTFRRDLFFRIHGACVSLPALRERTDRTALAAELLKRVLPSVPSSVTDLSPGACEWIEQHDWPGNVRELKSALVHAVAMADGQSLLAEHFPRVLVGLSASRREEATAPPGEVRTRVAILEQAIQEALRASAGNVSEAARRLGIARSTVYRAIRTRLS
jgi:transcriptional regulator of acetoin/glycerol metabolism